MAEQFLPKTVATRMKNLCVTCDVPSAFGYSSQSGESSSTGKSNLALGNSNDTINATTIETINLIAQNAGIQILNADVGQFYTLEVVEIRGFRATGDIDFNGANMVNINIDSGTLDNVVIGGDDPAEATFTDFHALGASGTFCFDWDSELDKLSICGSMFITGAINFGASGTNIYGDGTDLYLSVTGIYYQDIEQGHALTIGGDQTIIIDNNQFLTVSGNTIESFGSNLNTNVDNAYEINTGNTYSVESSGPLSLTSNDDLNLHADGCLNITADCLNFDIGTTSNFTFGDIVNIANSPIINIEDKLTLQSQDGMLIATSGSPLDIISQECINMTSEHCVNISAGTTMTTTVEGEYLVSTSGDINLYTESRAVRLLDNSCIYIGDDVSICGSSGTVSINSTNEILFNVDEVKIPNGGNLSVACVYLGTSAVSICGDDTNLTIFTTGCLFQDIQQCVDISIGTSYSQNITTDSIVNIGNDYNISVSGNSITTVEENKTTLIWGDEVIGITGSNTTNIGVFYNLTVNDDFITTVDNAYNINTGNTYSVESFGQMSLLSNEDLNLHADGCINITADCLNFDIGTTSSFTFGGDVNTTIFGNETKQISNDYNLTVENDQNIAISGSNTTTIGTFYNLTVTDDFITTVDNAYEINTGNTYSVESFGQMSLSSNADLNLHADGCINITTKCLNFIDDITINSGATMQIIVDGVYDLQVANEMLVSVGSTYELSTISDAIINSNANINLSAGECINLNAPCINIPGNLAISGTLTLPPNTIGTTYNLETTNDISLISQEGINISASGCVNIEAPCVAISGDINIYGSFTLPEAIEQQWVKYNDFDAIGTTQYVFVASTRTVGISGAGNYYWNFCNDIAESFYVSYDITQKILEAGSKGFQLKSIHPYYEVLNDSLNSASVNIIKHSLENFNPNIGRTGVPLEYDEMELNDSIGITRYYPSVGVSGEFLKGHESIMVEFCFDKKVSTDVHFYGMTIEFATII